MVSKGLLRGYLFKGLFLSIVLCLLWLVQAPAQTRVGGIIAEDTTWEGEVFLETNTIVKPPCVLTIKPGTKIYCQPRSALIIDRGAKIIAIGTPEEPIVFTSASANPARGDWGGISINGYGTTNATGVLCPAPIEDVTVVGEAGMGEYGGCDPHDSSGIFRYVRIEYGGFRIDGENEWNGLTLQGVGDETIIEYVQIDHNDDDGIEFFGGNANVRNILVTYCTDDQYDWTNGYQGKGQFIVALLANDAGRRGIEADNLKADNDAQPISKADLYNVTLIGNNQIPEEEGEGVLPRRGTRLNLQNSIIYGFLEAAVDIDNEATFARAQNGELIIDHNIIYNNLGGENFNPDESDEKGYTPPFTTKEFVTQMMQNNRLVDPLLNSTDWQNPDLRPSAGSPAFSGAANPPQDRFFVENADFIGAFDAQYDWTKGWTTLGGELAKMPVPTAPNIYIYSPQNYPYTHPNPKLARPMSDGFVEHGKASVKVGLHTFSAPVDIYLGISLPDGSLYSIDENNQFHLVTDLALVSAWRKNQTHSVYEEILPEFDKSALSPGTYWGWVLVVPTGTNMASFDFNSSPYYLWGFSETF